VKVKELEDKLGNDATKTNKMESSRASPEVRRLTECIEEMRNRPERVSDSQYIPTRFSTSRYGTALGKS
jgi:hypothetical protein